MLDIFTEVVYTKLVCCTLQLPISAIRQLCTPYITPLTVQRAKGLATRDQLQSQLVSCSQTLYLTATPDQIATACTCAVPRAHHPLKSVHPPTSSVKSLDISGEILKSTRNQKSEIFELSDQNFIIARDICLSFPSASSQLSPSVSLWKVAYRGQQYYT